MRANIIRQTLNLLAAVMLLLALYLPGFSAIPSQATTSSNSGSTTRIGMNIEQPNSGMYIDLFLGAGAWNSGANSSFDGSNLTANGYPASGQRIAYIWADGNIATTYNFYGQGNFTLTGFNGAVNYLQWPNNGTVPNSTVVGTAQNNWVTTCQIQLTPNTPPGDCIGYPIPPGGGYFWIMITANDPNNPPTNFHLMRSDYPAWPNTETASGYPFTKEFLAGLAPFCCLRFENWTSVFNGAPNVTTWESRPLSNMWGLNGNYVNCGAGLCYENMIALCNATGCDMWLNVPLGALTGIQVAWNSPTSLNPTDWMPNMAKLLASQLNPNLHVYYEIDDELWNWGYSGWGQVDSLAQSNPAVAFIGAPNLPVPNWPGVSAGAWSMHGGEMGFLIATAAQTMQPYLGTMGRPILAAQFAGYDCYTFGGLADLASIGKPSDIIYGLDYAPYIGLSSSTSSDSYPQSLDDVFQSMNDYFAGYMIPNFQDEVAMAQYYGVPHICCYEWGQTLVPWDNNSFNLFEAAQQDPRMGTIYNLEMSTLQSYGFDICNHYSYCYGWSEYGYWGALPSMWYLQNNQPTVKYSALASFAATCNCGNTPPPPPPPPPPGAAPPPPPPPAPAPAPAPSSSSSSAKSSSRYLGNGRWWSPIYGYYSNQPSYAMPKH